MGALGDFIRKKAREAVYSKVGAFNTLTEGKTSGGWFVGKTNPERTTIIDPNTNKTYDLIYTGQVQEYALAKIMNAKTAHAYGNPPRYQPSVEGAEVKGFLLYIDTEEPPYTRPYYPAVFDPNLWIRYLTLEEAPGYRQTDISYRWVMP